jgi:mRNA-degrading endonuclease RelE of RelBE toxin-antitoxin system
MTSRFRVLTTPSFERDFRKFSKGNEVLAEVREGLITILAEDPHNRSGRHSIKKLVGLRPGEGQWRIRWREYRLRYDIFGTEVVMHSFRHRKEAY